MATRKKILITGANGLLGQKLVQRLVEEGEVEVLATGRGECRLPGTGFKYLSLDIENEELVKTVLSVERPSIIIHGAAMTNVDTCELQKEACYRANVLATKYLVEGAEEIDAHFIFVSTDFIFEGNEGPLEESAVPNPVNFYGQTKLEGESILLKSKLKWAIARTVLVFGSAHDLSRSNIVLWVKESLESGKEIQVVDDQFRTPTLAEDLAEGCILIAKTGAAGIFHLSGPDFLTPYQMAQIIADFFGLDSSLIQRTDSLKFTQPAKRPLKTGFKIEKARKELGFEPKTFRAAIGILSKQIILARS
ncbi:SDR family oxidoreductase [Algoriphagus sp.]|uniref:SDR family oxidoreductase n=1 Tax=Algoriphagus sp. TaxID=1872435 RepID=UPI0026384EDF|nr:SDR family oxidoreductase [Algoriphagus sp.]